MNTTRILTPAIALVALAALAGCGDSTPTVKQSTVEDKISSGLEKEVGAKPDDVTCPDDLEGKVGTEMTCTLTAGSDQLDVSVEVTAVEGKKVDFDFEVAQMDDGGAGS